MTDDAESDRGAIPAILPFALNAALATGLGAFVGGWLGASIALALLVCVFALFWLVWWSRKNRSKISALQQAVLRPLRPVLALILLPFALAVSLPVVAAYSAWLKTERFFRVPYIDLGTPLVRLAQRFAAFIASGFRPSNLPGTALNLLLVVVLACAVVGIEVAFYAALAAVPIMLVTLMMLAIESSREPEE